MCWWDVEGLSAMTAPRLLTIWVCSSSPTLHRIRSSGGGVGTVLLMILVMLTLSNHRYAVSAEKSKAYSMQTLCKNHFLQQLYRKIDGAVLWSQNERNLDCVITFQTHSILQRFMLRFDFLQLDCNDHLYIYDGAHAVGTYKFDLSCRNTKQTLGAMFTRTNYVTMKYVTDGWGTESNGFKLVITAVKDPKHACTEFRCDLREFCIATDLVCDGINHCADGSDEATHTLCINNEANLILGMEKAWFVVVVITTLLMLLVCIVAVSICLCKRITVRTRNNCPQQNYSPDVWIERSIEATTTKSRFHNNFRTEPGKLVVPCGAIRVPLHQQTSVGGSGPPLPPTSTLLSGKLITAPANGGTNNTSQGDYDHLLHHHHLDQNSSQTQKDEWFV